MDKRPYSDRTQEWKDAQVEKKRQKRLEARIMKGSGELELSGIAFQAPDGEELRIQGIGVCSGQPKFVDKIVSKEADFGGTVEFDYPSPENAAPPSLLPPKNYVDSAAQVDMKDARDALQKYPSLRR